mgnify:CR=1 FL=1
MRVIGTAGHVDHGKSTLVLALTGIDPDRLREEKEREMTIDLGFAWLALPPPSGAEGAAPGSETVGVIDVPGHIDFIKNMLAGVGGIDAALFVVAADEGVMPQTREHLAILDLLQVPAGVVALTKTDAVTEDGWIELVQADLAGTLQGTCLESAPIVPVSARTGADLPKLKQALADVLTTVPPRRDKGAPRLPVRGVHPRPPDPLRLARDARGPRLGLRRPAGDGGARGARGHGQGHRPGRRGHRGRPAGAG